jgi:nitronate monooxygenase
VHYLTSPVRAASVRAGDPHAVNVWAGTGYRQVESAPVAAIIGKLTGPDGRETDAD